MLIENTLAENFFIETPEQVDSLAQEYREKLQKIPVRNIISKRPDVY